MSKVEFKGKMPDPFSKEDGTKVSPAEWFTYKKNLLDKIIKTEYGGMPPRPEVVKIEQLNNFNRGLNPMWYRIHAGSKERQLTFLLEITIPFDVGKFELSNLPLADGEMYPVILSGDGCYPNMESEVKQEITNRGFVAAKFNRLEIANDITGSQEGGIYDIYTGMDYTDISAWAWGYSVCMDVFSELPFIDETEVGITGHSRGGKTVLLAAAADERIKYVCPNNSGTHGANSYRCIVTEQGEINARSERLSDMLRNVPTWMGKALADYADKEENLPYDMHYFGAMIAPRYYLQCEGMQDYWINPCGAWQNFMAVKECYRYLGCEDHAGAWFRPGYHRHKLPDFSMFMDFIEASRKGLPLPEHLKINPYPDMEKNFDW